MEKEIKRINYKELPSIPTMHHERIPIWLKENGKFCAWKLKWDEKKNGYTKPPYSIRTGVKSNREDPNTYGSYDEAMSAVKRYNLTGIGLIIDDRFTLIDIDHCINDGVLHPFAESIIDSVKSYSEISPSGTGVHVICRTENLPLIENYKNTYRDRIPIDGMNFEVYPGKYAPWYSTITGNALSETVIFDGLYQPCDIEERSAEVFDILNKYMRRDKNTTKEKNEKCLATEDNRPKLTDEELIHHAERGKNGELFKSLFSGEWESIIGESGEQKYPSQSEADMAICALLAFYTGDEEQMERILSKSPLCRPKWDEARGSTNWIQSQIRTAIANGESVWNPDYGKETIDSFSDLLVNNIDRHDNEEAQKVLSFLKEKDVLNNPRYAADDIGNGNLLADYAEPFARCIDGKIWMYYDGRCWDEDRGNIGILETAKSMSRGFALYAGEPVSDEDRKKLLRRATMWTQHRNITIAINMAASVHPISRDMFDTDKYLLNVLNGTIDLRTRELRPHRGEDLLTKLAQVEYNPDATCERWDKFISEIMEPGESEFDNDLDEDNSAPTGEQKRQVACEKSKFLKKYLGYCLSGITKEETFLIAYGPTSRNGKSVMTDAVAGILGNYAKSVAPETMIQVNNRNGGSPSEDVARLSKIRLASVGELPQGGRLDASRVKLFTGNDTVTARFLGQNSFEFKPEFKLLMHTNHLPKVSDMSVFESGRVMLIPFSRHFEPWEQDKGLKDYFQTKENRSGILNWLLDGFSLYEKEGLSAPDVMRRAVLSYQNDSDKIRKFIDECLVKNTEGKEIFMDVYDRYKAWCVESGHMYESSGIFKSEITRRNIRVDKGRVGTSVPTTRVCGYNLKAAV